MRNKKSKIIIAVLAVLLALSLIVAASYRNEAKNRKSDNYQYEGYYSSGFIISKGIDIESFLGSSVVILELVPKQKQVFEGGTVPISFARGIVSPDGKHILSLYSAITRPDFFMYDTPFVRQTATMATGSEVAGIFKEGVDVFYGNYLLKDISTDKTREANISVFEIPASAGLKSQVKFGDSNKLEHLDSVILADRIFPSGRDYFHTKIIIDVSHVSAPDLSDTGVLKEDLLRINAIPDPHFRGAPVFAIRNGVPELTGILADSSIVLKINKILDLVKQETDIALR